MSGHLHCSCGAEWSDECPTYNPANLLGSMRVEAGAHGRIRVSTAGCGCSTHPGRALAPDGDPTGCYCDCADYGYDCEHGGAR